MSSTTYMTADELLALPDDGLRYELVKGELRRMSPAGFLHGVVISRVNAILDTYVQQSKAGVLASAETGFLLRRDPDTVRAPDLAIVLFKRLKDGNLPVEFFDGPPDLVIEVVSPRDTEQVVDENARMWLAAGTSAVWNIWPMSRTVHVYHADGQVAALDQSDVLRGEPLLPGFECLFAAFFPDDSPPG